MMVPRPSPPLSRAVLAATLGSLAFGCSKGPTAVPETVSPADGGAAVVATPTTTAPGAPRPGMVWVPSGVFKAGTAPTAWPRIAEEELPGTEVGLGGFYIDELPFPNEAGAIPTTNVTREDAAHLCEGKGKRLCTELEWERACKGPDSAAYEYGDTYRPSVCGTGVPAERAARRPSGERIACKSAFGVREMHGGVWEWTDSNWERGAPTKLAVLRGGNATAGEVVGRCANALGRAPTTKSGAMGLRCCAGPRNEAQVDLEVRGATGLEAVPIRADRPPWGPVEWRWRPVPNEEISIRGECADGPAVGIECVCRIFRPGEAVKDIARIETGKALCGMVQPASDPRDLRMLYMDARAQSRTVKYALGRVTVSAAR